MYFVENGIEYELNPQKIYIPGLFERGGGLVFPYYGQMDNWLVPEWDIEPARIIEMGLCNCFNEPESVLFFITYEGIAEITGDDETGDYDINYDIDTEFYAIQGMPEQLRALLVRATAEYMEQEKRGKNG